MGAIRVRQDRSPPPKRSQARRRRPTSPTSPPSSAGSTSSSTTDWPTMESSPRFQTTVSVVLCLSGELGGPRTAAALELPQFSLRTGEDLRGEEKPATFPNELRSVSPAAAVERVFHLLNESVAPRSEPLDGTLGFEVLRVAALDAAGGGDDQRMGEVAIRCVQLLVDVAELGEQCAVAAHRD